MTYIDFSVLQWETFAISGVLLTLIIFYYLKSLKSCVEVLFGLVFIISLFDMNKFQDDISMFFLYFLEI